MLHLRSVLLLDGLWSLRGSAHVLVLKEASNILIGRVVRQLAFFISTLICRRGLVLVRLVMLHGERLSSGDWLLQGVSV